MRSLALSLTVALALAGCTVEAVPTGTASIRTTAESPMTTTDPAATQATSRLLPLDAEVPATFETATFALG